ncbi:class I adenylate-forming enzyme family protein [Planctomycetota bacterium]
MQINHFLENAAQKYPDKEAVWHKDRGMTYAEIDALSNKVANYLKERNIRRGDRVAILYENSFDYVIAYFAVLKAGAVEVSLNTETTVDTLTYALNDTGAKAVITSKKHSCHLVPALRKSPEVREVIVEQKDLSAYEEIGHCDQIRLGEIYDSGDASPSGIRGIDVDLASITYTTGSTNTPKGVVHTHLNVVSNTRSIVEYLALTDRDRMLVILPFFYIYGKSLLTTHFYVGGSLVIENRFVFPEVVLYAMKDMEVTGFAGVPSTFLILLNRSRVREYTFEDLRYVTQAGGSMAPSVQKKVAEIFAPARLFIMYGATEAAPRLSYLDPDVLPSKWGSIGKAISNVDLFVADENGNPQPPDCEGQIVARGSNLMVGYWNDPIETAKVLRDGLYFTGDIGKMDDEGYLYVVGRSKDIIKAGGFRISAKEVEDALLEIDEIHEAVVVGVDDPILGEAIKAFIVLRDHAELTEPKLKQALKRLLPAYKQPTYIEFIDSIPKGKSGKILKMELKKQYCAHREVTDDQRAD